jgi:hypothetical protein
MAKTWSADNPKAALMARKRAVIVGAALKAFLEAGYAEDTRMRGNYPTFTASREIACGPNATSRPPSAKE